MSYLPELEQALLEAAMRLDSPPTATATRRSHTRRWRRMPLLAGVASLLLAGGAVAAVTGALDNGDPVPSAAETLLKISPGSERFVLADVRAADPDGGPAWGVGTYDAVPARALGDGTITCVVVGRVQNDQLGVVGRDGVFGNDGRFHPLTPASQSSTVCGGRAADASFVSFSSFPPIPASGYTGAPGTAIGGCRERVNLDGPTVSPQTRRKLRDVPQCDVAGLRRVFAGFAGPRAIRATLTFQGHRRELTLRPQDSGAYLFVFGSASTAPARLTITLRDGTICQAFTGDHCRKLFARWSPRSTERVAARDGR